MFTGPSIIVPMKRRRALRRDVHVQCNVITTDDFRLVGSGTRDLSPLGLRATSVYDCRLGDKVLISMCLPSGRSWLDAEGEVVRLIPASRYGEVGDSIAVRFRSLGAVDRAMLDGSLVGLPPPVPTHEFRADYAATVRRIADS